MADKKRFGILTLIICLFLTGCAVKRPIVIKVLPDRWRVHCPSDPRNDGAWWIEPPAKDAKEYCQLWHKWNRDNKIHRRKRILAEDR